MNKCEFCGTELKVETIKILDLPEKKILSYPCNCLDNQEKIKQELKIKESINKKIELLKDISTGGILFNDRTFDNFKVLDLNYELNLSICYRYAEDFSKNTMSGLILIGEAGTGKTHLAAAIHKELLNKGFISLFTSLSVLINKITQGYSDSAGLSADEIYSLISRCDFVIIDDLGRENYSDYKKEVVFNIFKVLYENKKNICITANRETFLKFNKNPELIAVADRVFEMCKTKIDFTGKSYRRMK